MTVDYSAVGIAAALRYAPGTLPTPGGVPALDPIAMSTAAAPSALTQLPAFVLFTDAGAFPEIRNGTRLGTAGYIGRFYYAEAGDLERDMAALTRWLTVLVDVHGTGLALGGLVVAIRTRTWKLGGMPYGQAGKTYNGIELGLEVVTSETWLPS